MVSFGGEAWAVQIIRLATKFGGNLATTEQARVVAESIASVAKHGVMLDFSNVRVLGYRFATALVRELGDRVGVVEFRARVKWRTSRVEHEAILEDAARKVMK